MAVYRRRLECFMIFAAATQSVLPGVGGLKYLYRDILRYVHDGTGVKEAIQKISLKDVPIKLKLSSQIPTDYIAPNIMPKILTTFRGLLHEHHTFPGGRRVIGTGHVHDHTMQLFFDQSGLIPELYAKLLLLGGLRQAPPRRHLTMLDQVVGRALHVHIRPFIQLCRVELLAHPNLQTIRACQEWCDNLELYTRGVISQIVRQLFPQLIAFVDTFLNRCLLIADDAKKPNFAYFPTGNTVGAQFVFYIRIMQDDYTNETESITIEKAFDPAELVRNTIAAAEKDGKPPVNPQSSDKQKLLAALDEINNYYGNVAGGEGGEGGASKQEADTDKPPVQFGDDKLRTQFSSFPEELQKEFKDKLKEEADSVSEGDIIQLAKQELNLKEALPSDFDIKLKGAFNETRDSLMDAIAKISDEEPSVEGPVTRSKRNQNRDPSGDPKSGESKSDGSALADALMLHFSTLKI